MCRCRVRRKSDAGTADEITSRSARADRTALARLDQLPVLDRPARHEQLAPFELAAVHVVELHPLLPQLEGGDVGDGTWHETPELRPAENVRGCGRGSLDDCVQWNTERQEPGHDRRETLDEVDRIRVGVAADHIGQEPLSNQDASRLDVEATAAVTEIEDDPALTRRPDVVPNPPIGVAEAIPQPREAVSDDVSRPKSSKDRLERRRRAGDVDHQRQPGGVGRLDSKLQRSNAVRSNRLRGYTDLDADDRVPVGVDAAKAFLDARVGEGLELPGEKGARETDGRDVQKGDDPLSCLPHVAVAERRVEVCAGASSVDEGRHPVDETDRGGGNAKILPVEHVDVQVDQSRRDDQPFCVDDLVAGLRRQ